MYHGNVFTETKYADEVRNILDNNFKNIVYKKNGKSVSVSVNYQDIKREYGNPLIYHPKNIVSPLNIQ